ncbi:hypothetical protein GTR04_6319 [Trichophyton interdigitale]|nr:hypothetical protein GTR04_6319 [Trichophyton interdigitale]
MRQNVTAASRGRDYKPVYSSRGGGTREVEYRSDEDAKVGGAQEEKEQEEEEEAEEAEEGEEEEEEEEEDGSLVTGTQRWRVWNAGCDSLDVLLYQPPEFRCPLSPFPPSFTARFFHDEAVTCIESNSHDLRLPTILSVKAV